MTINWKKRAKASEEKAAKAEEALLTLNERTVKVGFALVREKEWTRKALIDFMNAERKLARAIAAIDAAAEMFTTPAPATAATFRMIANDLCPRDTCAKAIVPQDEQA